jgi:hypothetical protein
MSTERTVDGVIERTLCRNVHLALSVPTFADNNKKEKDQMNNFPLPHRLSLLLPGI